MMMVISTLMLSVNVYADGSSPWHNLQQWERNQKIIDSSYQDINQWGDTCKVWMQNLVYRASGNHVWLPLNDSSNVWKWQSDTHGHIVYVNEYSSIPIENAQVGWIVQMKMAAGNPHTQC